MLTLSDVTIRYGRVAAVQRLSIDVAEGEFVGIVGHNGVGKTTTLGAISGLLRPSEGDIVFNGRSIAGCAPDEVLRAGIALVPENRRIFARLTVLENLLIGTSARRDRAEAQRDVQQMLERFPVLGRFREHLGAELSGGQQQQLAIARALLCRPRLLLLDEPTLGLAPLMVDAVFDILAELHADGVTMLLVEQNALRTVEASDRTYVLRAGGVVAAQGTASELRAEGDFESMYLGMTRGATA